MTQAELFRIKPIIRATLRQWSEIPILLVGHCVSRMQVSGCEGFVTLPFTCAVR